MSYFSRIIVKVEPPVEATQTLPFHKQDVYQKQRQAQSQHCPSLYAFFLATYAHTNKQACKTPTNKQTSTLSYVRNLIPKRK